jgi:hypothetical protein
MLTVLLKAAGQSVGDAALFLIVGGLFMLGLVVVLIVLRSVFPAPKKASPGLSRDTMDRALLRTHAIEQGPRTSRPLLVEELGRGRAEAQRLRPPTLDAALDVLVRRGAGDPRVLRMRDEVTVVRLENCGDCRAAPTADTGCGVVAGFLEGVLRGLEGAHARVQEVACRRAGARACEFEVKH